MDSLVVHRWTETDKTVKTEGMKEGVNLPGGSTTRILTEENPRVTIRGGGITAGTVIGVEIGITTGIGRTVGNTETLIIVETVKTTTEIERVIITGIMVEN